MSSHVHVNRNYFFSIDKRYSFGMVACLSSIAVHLEHGQARVIKFFSNEVSCPSILAFYIDGVIQKK